jgi:hypothetical protein
MFDALGEGAVRLNVQPIFGGNGKSFTKRFANSRSPSTRIKSNGAPPWITAAMSLGAPMKMTSQLSAFER